MKVYVMGSTRRNGVSKKTNVPYDSIVIQGVYSINGQFSVKELWIDPELLQGVIPVYGDVLDIQVDFSGYVQSVTFAEHEKFALNVRQVNNK